MLEETLDQSQASNQSRTLEDILVNGYSFNIEEVFGLGLKLFQERLWSSVAYATLLFIVFSILGFIPFLGFLCGILLTPALQAGYFLVAHKVFNEESVEFEDFFGGFKEKFFTLCTKGLIIAGIIVILSFFTFVLSDYSLTSFGSIWYLLGHSGMKIMMLFLSLIFLSLFSLLLFSTIFLLFENLSPWESITTSAKFVLKNFSQMLGLSLALVVLNALGAVFALVGLLFTVPLSHCVLFATYTTIFEKKQTDKTL